MNNQMLTKEEVKKLILSGKVLMLSADEKLLADLPKGEWIGGSIPYFISSEGGIFSTDKIFVTEAPAEAVSHKIAVYSSENISEIYKDVQTGGFAFVIIPGFSKTHYEFALKAPSFENFGHNPLIGWIAGFDLNKIGTATAKVFDGRTGDVIEDGAVTLKFVLPKEYSAEIQIVNIFEQGSGDIITFVEDGFSAEKAFINGVETNFAEYISDRNIDVKLPLVADMYGALINTSFQSIDTEKKIVNFYAPVFKGVEYKIGAPIEDYVSAFISKLPAEEGDKIRFSCNCILNYLYAALEGKKTGSAIGPITFGEIAYQLLNQTMTYLTIEKTVE